MSHRDTHYQSLSAGLNFSANFKDQIQNLLKSNFIVTKNRLFIFNYFKLI